MIQPNALPFVFAVVACLSGAVQADRPIRIASYNIFFLKSTISDARRSNLKEVIQVLNADILGLQEIEDRAALEQIFDPSDWSILIDDDSSDGQDVASVVRKPLQALRRSGQQFDFDADDDDFLFTGSQFESAYPNRRDALCADSCSGQSRRSYV